MKQARGNSGLYSRIFQTVLLIPRGRVATYGQVARIAGRCTPRQVGYAMYSVPHESQVPWHRVVNSMGRISIRSSTGEESFQQRAMLESEGVEFDERGRIDLLVYGWSGCST